jgi:hypothetical protein
MQADEGVRDVGVGSAKAGAIDVDEVIEGGRGGAVVGLQQPLVHLLRSLPVDLAGIGAGQPIVRDRHMDPVCRQATRGRGDRQTIGLEVTVALDGARARDEHIDMLVAAADPGSQTSIRQSALDGAGVDA